MTIANSHLDFVQQARPKTGFHFDLSFLRHFIGVFAIGFSLGVWYAILHFGLHLL